MDAINEILTKMPNFGLLLVGLILSKYFFDMTTKYKFDTELTENDNPAFGVALAGYLFGSGMALSGAVFGAGFSLTEDAIHIAIMSVLIIVLMRVSVIINDLAILYKFSISKELIEDKNVGTGFVLAGGSIATGCMLNGALSGQSDTIASSVVDIIIFWTIGQVILILGGLLFQAITRYDIHKVIGEDNNLAAGLSFGGFLAAQGIIIRNALYGASSNIVDEIIITSVFAVFGVIILIATRIIVDRVFLPKSPLSKEIAVDRNVAAGTMAAASFIIVAIIFAASISPNSSEAASSNNSVEQMEME
jgi:uncharacterized membrane protein YjfL (UPF0719 family)